MSVETLLGFKNLATFKMLDISQKPLPVGLPSPPPVCCFFVLANGIVIFFSSFFARRSISSERWPQSSEGSASTFLSL